MDGTLETRKTLTVRFTEFQASVTGMTHKVSIDYDEEDSLLLTDGQGNRIVNSEGSRDTVEHLLLCDDITIFVKHTFFVLTVYLKLEFILHVLMSIF